MVKTVFLWIACITLLIAVVLGADYFIGYKWFSFIEPKKENVRREVFLNTRSYVEGKTQSLVKMRLEYLQADDESKKIIADTIVNMFAEFDENKLSSPVLKSFLKKIKYGEY